jgi:hypothetical protein
MESIVNMVCGVPGMLPLMIIISRSGYVVLRRREVYGYRMSISPRIFKSVGSILEGLGLARLASREDGLGLAIVATKKGQKIIPEVVRRIEEEISRLGPKAIFDRAPSRDPANILRELKRVERLYERIREIQNRSGRS